MRFPKDALKVQTQQVLITLPQNDQNPAHVQEHTLKLREINDQNPTRVPTRCPNMTWTQLATRCPNMTWTQHVFLQDALTRPEPNPCSYKMPQHDLNPTWFPTRCSNKTRVRHVFLQDQNSARFATRCPNMTRTQPVFLQAAPI